MHMLDVLFVAPAGDQRPEIEWPSALDLLNYTVHPMKGGDQALCAGTHSALAMVDARQDLAGARSTCQLLSNASAGWPILLLIPASGVPVLSAEWSIDDFILDDAEPAEFDARIKLLMAAALSDNALKAGPVLIDESAYTATAGGQQLDLTYTEFELLKYLASHPGRVLTREQLLSEVWGYDYFGGTRTVDVHIRRLRAKLGAEYDSCIGTVRNVGYRFISDRQI